MTTLYDILGVPSPTPPVRVVVTSGPCHLAAQWQIDQFREGVVRSHDDLQNLCPYDDTHEAYVEVASGWFLVIDPDGHPVYDPATFDLENVNANWNWTMLDVPNLPEWLST